ncbi:MAG: hypothetical protein RJB39_136 [Candidatus Parcubacteria bacterium]|jgi:predicted PurR-regulated permease PerM
MQNVSRARNIFFIVLLIIFGVLSFSVLSKFLIVLALAYICALLVLPLQKRLQGWLERRKGFKRAAPALASTITLILLVVLIITPFSLMLGKIFTDAQGFYVKVTEGGTGALSARIENAVQPYFPNVDIKINEIAQGISGFVVSNIGSFFSSTFDIVLKLFLFLIALFYFLKDRTHFATLYARITPLSDKDNDRIFTSIRTAARSIMIGSLVVALCQGIVTGIGFAIFGVPNPFFWGAVAGMFALVPAVGPALIWIPAVIYLYVTGDPGSIAWIGQLIWGVVAVGLIDNILGPLVINKGISIHPLFILLSVIGGIAMFGPEGFLFGPLVLSIFVAIIEAWKVRESGV